MDKFVDNIVLSRDRKEEPLYEQIRQQLQRQIRSNAVAPGTSLPRISSLARKLNVNYRTVRTALELLEQDGLIRCQPHRGAVVAGSEPTEDDSDVRLVIAHVRIHGDAFCVALAEGICRFAAEYGLEYQMINAGHSHERCVNAIRHPGDGVNGMILLPYELAEYVEAIRDVVAGGVEVVTVDRDIPGLEVNTVSADHFATGYLASQHLLEQHGRPVYHVGLVTRPSSCREWVRGWQTAMQEYDFRDTDRYLFGISYSDAEQAVFDRMDCWQVLVDAAEAFFDQHDEGLYSIFAGNDYVARALYAVAEERGYRVGRDVFLAGVADLPLATRLPVSLTSVDQHPMQVGYEAAKILYERLTGQLGHPVHRLVPVDLRIRQSSLRPGTSRAAAGE